MGDGTGIGLSASEGAFLHRCTFENWEIGAYGGLGSWVNATGIGLSASEGAFLHRCTFENWEIGAYGGLGSWVNATGCTFRGNDVGL